MLSIQKEREVDRMFAKKMEMCCRMHMCMQMCMCCMLPFACCRGIR